LKKPLYTDRKSVCKSIIIFNTKVADFLFEGLFWWNQFFSFCRTIPGDWVLGADSVNVQTKKCTESFGVLGFASPPGLKPGTYGSTQN
jgi:hypothetical protein